MPCSVVRSDRAVPREGWRSRAGSSGWVRQPQFWLHPPRLLCATPSLSPNRVAEALLFSQAQLTWDILCLSENDRSWDGPGVTNSTGHCPPQGADMPAFPGSSELNSPAQDLAQRMVARGLSDTPSIPQGLERGTEHLKP